MTAETSSSLRDAAPLPAEDAQGRATLNAIVLFALAGGIAIAIEGRVTEKFAECGHRSGVAVEAQNPDSFRSRCK